MKTFRAGVGPLLLAGMVAAAAACGDGVGPGPASVPGFVAEWAGRPWLGDASATLERSAAGDTLRVSGVTPPDAGQLPSAYVWIRVPARGPGDYPLGPGDAELTYLVGGDVRTAAYATTRPGAGTLTIREQADGWVSGTVEFEASAVMEHAPVGPAARFEGSFRGRVRSR
ncbi:MAG TPA: hypothetical protein VHG91_20290 [Longimicrobium sp.]|nr:hypothetical protein [Longimicrobium sp.]